MSTRGVRARRSARQQRKGLALVAVAAMAIAAVIGTRAWLARSRPPLDPDSLCPLGGPEGLTVVIVDRTESLTAVQAAALRHRLEAVKNALPSRQAIEVYAIAPMGRSLLQPNGARVCSPTQTVSAWTANPKRAHDLWKRRFSDPLEDLFQSLLTPHEEPTSPILETLQSVSVTAFETVEQSTPRRLVVASDMLQNTPELSQYRDQPTFKEFRKTPYYLRTRATLTGVDVTLLYIRRENGLQGEKHIEFWQNYFADSGATLSTVSAVP